MKWRNEIAAAKKREKDYLKEGQRILDIYTGKKDVPFNILYSNTETLLPALYSAIPRPVVTRRFKDNDPIALEASKAAERCLEYLLDTNVDGYETFDEGMRAAVLDGLLPGRGITSVKYDAEIQEVEDKAEGELEGTEDQESIPYKGAELVCLDSRAWNRVFYGYAKKWSDVPWIAYQDYIDKEEATRLLGPEVAEKLVYSAERDETDEEKRGIREEEKSERKVACIYQIWEKKGKKVIYVTDQIDDILKEEEDPLQLTGFFNQPKPIMFIEKSSDLNPTALYLLYQNQAEELNRIQRRINKLVEAIRARGFYDGALGDDLANLVRAGDNELIPAAMNSSMAAEKGISNAIWWMPIEQLVNTLIQMYQARESCKQVIYEVTGISDIIRGSSVASETATAQNLKSQWGTLRLKRVQKEVQRYARDLLRMMLEIAATKFSEETWAKMTGLPFVTTDQRAQDEQMFQLIQAQLQMMPPPMPGPPGPDGQPTPPPPNPLQQQAQQLQAELQKPVWGQVLEILRNDMQRSYRIDIETNSTLEPEAAEDQKNIADMLNAFGQSMNSLGPLIQSGMLPFEIAQTILLAICRRYRFGRELEDMVKNMKAPAPPQDPNAGKIQAEQQKLQAEMQIETQRFQMESQAFQQEHALKMQEMQGKSAAEREKMQIELETARQEHAMKMQEMAAKMQMNEVINASKIRVAQMTAQKKEKESQNSDV